MCTMSTGSAEFFEPLSVGLLTVCLPHRSDRNDILTIMGALFASTIFLGVYNSSSVQPVVATERTVFYREKAAGADECKDNGCANG